MTVIFNRYSPHESIEGRKLEIGEVRKATDFYESTSGRWIYCPPGFVGTPIEHTAAIYVRVEDEK